MKTKILIAILIITAATLAASAQTTPPRSTYVIPGVNSTTQTLLNQTQPYKKIVTRVTQSSTTAPVDTAFEDNQATAHTWHYITVGDYRIKCAGCFSTTKTIVFTSPTTELTQKIRTWVISSDSVGVQTFDTISTKANGLLTNTPFEIRMYP